GAGGGGEEEHLHRTIGRYWSHPDLYSQSAPLFKLIFILMILMTTQAPGVSAIDCFVCTSIAGNNPACEDPFHNNYTTNILHSPCRAGRKNRAGLFPATTCIKMAGYFYHNGTSMVVRTCALDSGTLTTDTEIIRMSHCGSFYFEGSYIKGCLQSCDDADGCNGASRSSYHTLTLPLCLMLPLLLMHSTLT
ncbi:unnamed protein product, partial [Meganyctiphanes norvegica]